MKKIIGVIVLGILFTSCFDPKKGELDVDITTFKGPVKFENLCSDKIKEKSDIESHIFSMALNTKYKCKNIATYKPMSCSFFASPKSGDTIFVTMKGTAENAYGVPGEINSSGRIVKGKLLDSIFVY